MISKKMADRINLQINREMYSAFLYMAMSAKLSETGYRGAAAWMMIQYHEEMFHAMKFYRYLEDQGAAAEIGQIDKPVLKGSSMKELFSQALEHEKFVTKSIGEITALAREEKDYATEVFNQWYVNEQVEEEKNATEILQTLELLGGNAQGAYLLNVELGKRKLGVPSDFTEIESED